MEYREALCEVVKNLKNNGKLELPWFLGDNKGLFFCVNDNNIVAVIRLSQDPLDNDVTWIDEFEVIREYRNQGFGKKIVLEFLDTYDSVVKLLAKNQYVSRFWRKCGFKYDNPTEDEITMIYCGK